MSSDLLCTQHLFGLPGKRRKSFEEVYTFTVIHLKLRHYSGEETNILV